MKENAEILKKVLVCSYIIIALLILNTIILICKGNISTSTVTDTESEETTEYDVSMMESADLATIVDDVFNREDAQVIYMGRSTCSHCVSFLPSLQEAQDELGYTTVYLDITTVDTDADEYSEFIEALDIEYTMDDETDSFGSFFGYTPMVVIFKDGKMIDGVIGELDYDDLIEWLEENGVGQE